MDAYGSRNIAEKSRKGNASTVSETKNGLIHDCHTAAFRGVSQVSSLDLSHSVATMLLSTTAKNYGSSKPTVRRRSRLRRRLSFARTLRFWKRRWRQKPSGLMTWSDAEKVARPSPRTWRWHLLTCRSHHGSVLGYSPYRHTTSPRSSLRALDRESCAINESRPSIHRNGFCATNGFSPSAINSRIVDSYLCAWYA